jgi:hypothetical protein
MILVILKKKKETADVGLNTDTRAHGLFSVPVWWMVDESQTTMKLSIRSDLKGA